MTPTDGERLATIEKDREWFKTTFNNIDKRLENIGKVCDTVIRHDVQIRLLLWLVGVMIVAGIGAIANYTVKILSKLQ